MTAPLIHSLNLKVKGVPAHVRRASLLVLGCELHHCKERLGYSGLGSWQAYREECAAGTRPTWVEFCRSEAEISDTSASNYYKGWVALKNRLHGKTFKGAQKLLKQMGKVPSELTVEERGHLIAEIARMIPDSTQTLLRKEFHAAKPTPEELKECNGDPEATARLEERKRDRANGVLLEELWQREPTYDPRFDRLAVTAFRKAIAAGQLRDLLDQ